ncbi:MAG: EipA family protein, partial [Pseudomonadota bacterium]
RYPGVSGSAYLVGGVGMTVLKNRNVALVPIKTGVGARLGLNVGYLKLTRTPTWNPF